MDPLPARTAAGAFSEPLPAAPSTELVLGVRKRKHLSPSCPKRVESSEPGGWKWIAVGPEFKGKLKLELLRRNGSSDLAWWRELGWASA